MDLRAGETPGISELLRAWREGGQGGGEVVWTAVYAELREMARHMLRGLPPGASLQPTALVHEAWLKLAGDSRPPAESRRQFFFAVSRAMHDALVEHARAGARDKRGGGRQRVDLASLDVAATASPDQLLALEDALDRLAARNRRLHEIVELRFFGGLSAAEAAEVLGASLSTVEREWRLARAWLHRELSGCAEAPAAPTSDPQS